MPNRLASETSPYLLQHADNPVDWYPWSKEAFEKAKAEDKPVIVSIGYSTCHWCHVMEHESFENEAIAKIMNEHYVCIKVDREERPDVDQIYMDAIHNMGLRGGWPLNVFLMPDAQPFYGGTYFPLRHWEQLLHNVADAFQKHRAELEESAAQFTQSVGVSDLLKYGLKDTAAYTENDLHKMYRGLEKRFDKAQGGTDRAPKFPMPSIYKFLLRYGHLYKHEAALAHVRLTLNKMALGGIYDHVGGGFARYSTDGAWFAPHFEKMLYDNGQLTALYAEAYTATGEELFKRTVYETLTFIEREMTSPEGGFYSALDADSEGEEGKFYVWRAGELREALGEDYELFAEYFSISEEGNWEYGNNILYARATPEAFAEAFGLDPVSLLNKLNTAKRKLTESREGRIRPGRDEKIIAGWNGLMLRGLAEAYRTFTEPSFLQAAVRNADFIQHTLLQDDLLYHSVKDGKHSGPGFADDYVCVADGLIALYEVSFDEKYLRMAKKITDIFLENFYDESEGFFFYTDRRSEELIVRKKELFDNVIPGSNSMAASVLHALGLHLDEQNFIELAAKMVSKVKKLLLAEPSHMTAWASAALAQVHPPAEVAVAGPEAEQFRINLEKKYFPDKIITGSTRQSRIPLLQERFLDGETMIYVCRDKACKLPTDRVEEAWKEMEQLG